MKKRRFISLLVLLFLVGILERSDAVTQKGLVAYYPLDVNVNNRFNQPSKSQYFDGLYEFTVIDQDEFITGNLLTVSFWLKPSNTTKKQQFFMQCSDFAIWQYKDKIGIAISHPATKSASGKIPAFDQWTHFLGTFDGSYIRTYINGELADTTYHPGTISDTNQKLTIGFAHLSYWEGTLDDLRIYDRVLHRDEIKDLATIINGVHTQAPPTQSFETHVNVSLE